MANLSKIISSVKDSSLVEKAFDFAKNAHRGQKRFSGEDYIFHPLRVAEILAQLKLDSKTIAAGLLHDVPDDTSIPLKEIEKNFGKEISFLVSGVSKLGKIRYPKFPLKLKSIEDRLEEPIDLRAENLRKMFLAMAEDLRVILIKLADRLHNMETLNHVSKEKQKRIALETLEIFAPLADRLGIGEIKGKLEDLAFLYLYPDQYYWLLKHVKERYEEREKYLKKVLPVLKEILKKEQIFPLEICYRAKTYWSLYQKLLRKEMDFDQIHDLLAMRIIVDEIKTCYQILGILHRYWRPLPGKIKDYIAFPKPNGYQSLHTTCFCLEGKITEFQIRTKKMDEEAKFGICAHWAHKEKIPQTFLKRELSWVSQLKDWQKEIQNPKEFLESLKIDFFKNRIFVFTPKGEVINLPEGATPVDFAYAVHTEIGNHCVGAKINGKLAPLSRVLKNGDLIEILVDKNKKPSLDWLGFVKTSLAKIRIKKSLRKESKKENLERGIKILNRELKELGISFLNQLLKQKLIKSLHFKDWENLVLALGLGEISIKEIVKILAKEKEILPLPKPKTKKEKVQILLGGEKGISFQLAKCCLPQPGDKILAYITSRQKASVHKILCPNLKRKKQKFPQKIVKASWEREERILYPVLLKIEAIDRIGLFKDISSAISSLSLNILSCQAKSQPKSQPAVIFLEIEVSGLEELKKALDQLKLVEGVLEVKRI